MFKRIGTLTLIFACTAVAWMILGTTIFSRAYSPASDDLKSRVSASWGTPQQQSPPSASYQHEIITSVVTDKGRTEKRTTQTVPLDLEGSKIDVTFNLTHRQKGLLWYSTYAVKFAGDYTFNSSSNEIENVTFRLPFPASEAIYDDLVLLVDGQALPIRNSNGYAVVTAPVAAHKSVLFHTEYRSQGLDSWHYSFGVTGISQVRDFALDMHTNFKDIDFPDNTVSPTTKQETSKGWNLAWDYKNLISGYEIGMVMPQKLQPGPLAGQISYFAPVSLFFFFFLMFIITTVRGIDLHPMNYFFLACAFFAFHLLLAYLVDHISIHLAFFICSFVSIFLVISYLRLVVGMRFAAVEAGLAQLVYLVLFSYAFFFKGFTGLAITIGSIITLFVVMQVTGRVKWAEKFAAFSTDRTPARNSIVGEV